MHKMLFNTGVRPENARHMLTVEHYLIHEGTVHIEYFLEREPEAGLSLVGLSDLSRFKMSKNQVAIKIVGGGMMSDHAFFNSTRQADI